MSRTPFTLAFCSLLAACVAPTEAPDPPADDPAPPAVTSIELTNTVPDDGASSVYPADPFTLWFSAEPDGVAVTIDGVDAVITVPASTAQPLKAPFMNAPVKNYFVTLNVLVFLELTRAFSLRYTESVFRSKMRLRYPSRQIVTLSWLH